MSNTTTAAKSTPVADVKSPTQANPQGEALNRVKTTVKGQTESMVKVWDDVRSDVATAYANGRTFAGLSGDARLAFIKVIDANRVRFIRPILSESCKAKSKDLTGKVSQRIKSVVAFAIESGYVGPALLPTLAMIQSLGTSFDDCAGADVLTVADGEPVNPDHITYGELFADAMGLKSILTKSRTESIKRARARLKV